MKKSTIALLYIDTVNRTISISDENGIWLIFGPDSSDVLYKRNSAEDLLVRALLKLLPKPLS